MPKQTKKQQNKVRRVMHEFKHGELKSSSGKKVKSRDQAIAIGLSEAGVSRKKKTKGKTAKHKAAAKTKKRAA